MQEKNQQMYMDIQQLPDEEVFRMSSEALKTGGHIFVYDLLFLRLRFIHCKV